ncbi:MAG TPA: YugN family protein [Bacillota bacterium]|nr:YugN family protein [Bacillota bacterium]
MKIADSLLQGHVFNFSTLDHLLHQQGFVRGAMWDWDYAAYDYALSKSQIGFYTYLRICVDSVKGHIEESDCQVKVTDVFVTEAKYHSGLDLDKEVDVKHEKEAQRLLQIVADKAGLKGDIKFRSAEDKDKQRHVGSRKKH